MIVKVSKGDGKWILLNDVRSIDYSSIAKKVTSGEELQHQLTQVKDQANGCEIRDALMEINWGNPSAKLGPSNPYCFNSMIVELVDRTRTCILFDHPVYLCDDAGNTVDKINVR